MDNIKEKDLGKISGGSGEFEMRKCICQRCGKEFEERYPTTPGVKYMYWGKGLYCKDCWKIAHDEMGKKK